MEDAGAIESIGRGKRRPVRLREAWPFTNLIQTLFKHETEQAERVIAKIRAAINVMSDQPGSAWLEGAVARGTDEPNDPLVVGVLLSRELDENEEIQLRIRINDIQHSHDVGIELRYWRREDIEAATPEMLSELGQVQMIFGPHPLDIAGARQAAEVPPGQSQPRIHKDREAESLERAQAIANALQERPDLIQSAIVELDRRMEMAAPGVRVALQEWKNLLETYSLGRLRRFLTSDSERAKRMRQSLPSVLAELGARERRGETKHELG
jgi:hypothetical protein